MRAGFWWRNLRERDNLEDPGVDGRIILRGNEIWGMNWIDLAQDRDRWRVLVNSVKWGEFLDWLRTG